MSSRVLRAAIVGCGEMAVGARGLPFGLGARSHVEAYQACERTTLVAGYDPDAAARARFTSVAGAPAFGDLDEMLRVTAPELITIASPDATHVDLLERVLAARVRGVLMEKPLALTVAEAARAKRIAERSDALIAMNFSRRYAPVLRELAGRIRGGEFGQPQVIRGTYTNGLRRNGSHLLDLVRWWGGEIAALRASSRLPGAAADPTVDLDCDLENALKAQLIGLDGRAFDHFELDLIATRGRIRLVQFGHAVEIYVVRPSKRHPGYREETLVDTRHDVLLDVTRHAVDALAASILDGGAPLSALDDGVAAVAAVEAAHRSLQTRAPEAPRRA